MDQLTLRQILKKDKFYRKWFARTPRLKFDTPFPPWRLWIQREPGGKWGFKDFDVYAEAYQALSTILPKCHDAALGCKPQGFNPPVIKVKNTKHWAPMPVYHNWCPHCRRPTIFVKRRRCITNRQIIFTEPTLMCGICGVRKEFLDTTFSNFRTTLEWPI